MALPLRLLSGSEVGPLGVRLTSVESVTGYLDTHMVPVKKWIRINFLGDNTDWPVINEEFARKHFKTANDVRSLGKIKAFLADYYDWLLSDDIDLRYEWEEQVWSPLGSKDEFIAKVIQLNRFAFNEFDPETNLEELVLRVDLRERFPGPALSSAITYGFRPASEVVDSLGNRLTSVESVTNYLDTHMVPVNGFIYINFLGQNADWLIENEDIAREHFTAANDVRSLSKITAFLADYYDRLLSGDILSGDIALWEKEVWAPLGSKDEFIAKVIRLNRFDFIEVNPETDLEKLVLRVDLSDRPPGPASSLDTGTFRDLASDMHTAEPEYPCDNFEEGDATWSERGWDSKHIADSGGYIILPGTRPQDPKHCVSVEYMRNACETRQLDIWDQMGGPAGYDIQPIDSCFNPFTNAKFTPIGSTLIRGILSGGVAPSRPRTHNKPDVWDIEKILTPGQLFYQ